MCVAAVALCIANARTTTPTLKNNMTEENVSALAAFCICPTLYFICIRCLISNWLLLVAGEENAVYST